MLWSVKSTLPETQTQKLFRFFFFFEKNAFRVFRSVQREIFSNIFSIHFKVLFYSEKFTEKYRSLSRSNVPTTNCLVKYRSKSIRRFSRHFKYVFKILFGGKKILKSIVFKRTFSNYLYLKLNNDFQILFTWYLLILCIYHSQRNHVFVVNHILYLM